MNQVERAAVVTGPRGVRLTLLLAALVSMGPLSIDMYLPALPGIAAGFGVGATQVQLTLSTFFIGFAAGQLVYGPISDRVGRKRPLLFGLVLFILASLCCSVATSVGQLIGLRVLEALGACCGTVLARAAVRDLYGKDESARIMSYMMLAMGLAPMLAPIIGGQVLLWAGWRAIFVLLSAIGVLLLVLAWRAMPESLPPSRRQRLSVRQMLYGYFSLLRDRNYIGYVLASSCIFGGMFAYISGSPFVFIEVYGVAPQQFGLLFGLNVIGMMGGALLNGRLIPRYGSDRILRVGVAMAATAGATLAIVAGTGFGGLPALLAPLFCYISSISLIGPNATAGALSARPEIAGAGAALAGALQFASGSLAGAIVGVLHDGTAVPMAGTIATGSLLGFCLHRWLVLGRKRAA